MKGYPAWFSRYFIISVVALMFLSGILLAPMTLENRLSWSVLWRFDPSWRIGVSALHTAIGFLTFGVLGALWAIHMRVEWKKIEHRTSGIALTVAFLLLGLTAVGILYSGNEGLLTTAALSHLIIGILVIVFFIWHLAVKASKKKRKRSQ